MRITPSDAFPENVRRNILRITNTQYFAWVGLSAILALAAFLLFSNLGAIGYGNTYYTAAVKSMLQSWHNFFFVAAEPGGSVSVDKPPVGFWLQAISAYFLGVNGFAVVLPQIIAGLLSIGVLYHLVRRSYGVMAGLLAALALAITPVVIATDRNNTIDTTLILTLLLAAWAFIKATETGRMRFLLLGAALVGVGFNIKMLEAYLPLPAFYALYFLGSAERVWRKIGKLALASALLLAISLSWAVAVDLTPANQRPYVGSSGDNSEMSLIIGYNGIDRLLGMFGRRGNFSTTGDGLFRSGAPGSRSDLQQAPGGFPAPGSQSQGGPGGLQPPPPGYGGFNNGGGFPPQPRTDGQGGQSFGGSDGGPGGFFETGQPGPLRLFISPLSKEMSWLLPLGLLGALLLLFRTRLNWPLSRDHQVLVLWGGWLLTAGVFFSVAGFFHQYYLSTMAPPLGALVGIGMIGLWQMGQKRPWPAFGLLLAIGAGTLAFQIGTAKAFGVNAWWLPWAVALLVLGIAGLFVGIIMRADGSRTRAIPVSGEFPLSGGLPLTGSFPQARQETQAENKLRNKEGGRHENRPLRVGRLSALAGYACVLAALLLTPGIWSGLTTFSAEGNQALPAAYGGAVRGFGPRNSADLQVNRAVLSYLEQNTRDVEYLVAVPSAMQGSGYVLATGRPVLYMGGFSGQDQVVTSTDLGRLVAEGRLRYILLGGGFGGNEAQIAAWVRSSCSAVSGLAGSASGSGGGFGFGSRGGGETLYDCRAGM